MNKKNPARSPSKTLREVLQDMARESEDKDRAAWLANDLKREFNEHHGLDMKGTENN